MNWLESSPLDTEHFTEKLRQALLSAIERKVRELTASVGCDAKLTVDLGSPIELLPQVVKDAGADVLVIGRGREQGQIGRLWSRAYELIRRSPVPVISV